MHKIAFRISSMCRVLKVRRSGYYNWLNHSGRSQKDPVLLNNIHRVFQESRKTYGSPRVYRQLKSEGVACGRNRIAQYMRDNGIVARKRRKYKKPVSRQRLQPAAQNILNREFKVQTKNRIWACDVSYFWTRNGWIH